MPHRVRMLLTLAFAVVLPLGACSAPSARERETNEDVDYAERDTYVWEDSRAPIGFRGRSLVANPVEGVLHETVDEELAASEMFRVSERRDAALVLVSHLGLEVRQEARDPYYTQHVAERVEFGVLSLSILDGESGETLWSGESRARLRTLAQGYGLSTLRWRDVDEERRWPTAELVETLLDASPLRSVDPARRAELTQPSGLLGRRAKRDLYRRLYETTPAR